MKIVDRIFDMAARSPDHDALIFGVNKFTYRELHRKIMTSALIMREMGVRAGDRVVIAAGSHPCFAFGYFGIHYLGAAAVPVDPKVSDRHFAYILQQTEPRAIFTLEPKHVGKFECRAIDVLDRQADGSNLLQATEPNDISDVIFTSGTTGTPKGVVLTHRNVVAAASNLASFIGNTYMDREVIPLPLSHGFGLGRFRSNMFVGATTIPVDGFLQPEKIFQAFEFHNATGFCSVPAGLALLFHLTNDRLGQYSSQLKYMEIGSASMLYEHKRRLMALLPTTRICMHYGLTETSRVTFTEFHAFKKKLKSIGKPAPNVKVRVIDPDGDDVPTGEIGEIAVSSEAVMKEYWKDESKTAKAIKNGWFYTGDLGYLDGEGYFFLKGRADEMINVGGLKVAPIEIEDLLRLHPSIGDCACVGIPDPAGISGQIVKAYLVHNDKAPKPESEELTNFLAAKCESFKIPSLYEWISVIPKTPSGKLQRTLLAGKVS